ncbi:type II secretion system protein [Desulfovulcanus sp.]
MKKNYTGFTLIEMAVVLVIIGLILAGVMKAKDMIRNAQVKEFTNNFVLAWKDVTYSYYDRISQILGDGTDNGGIDLSGANGFFDNFDGTSQANAIVGNATEVGIDPCSIVKSDMGHTGTYCAGIDIFKRTVSGEYIKSQVSIGFYNATTPLGTKNILIFKDVPSDVARGIDAAIDGQVKAQAGSVLACDTSTSPVDCTSSNWSDSTAGKTDTLGLVVDF